MKKSLLIVAAALLSLAGCCKGERFTVVVSNTLPAERIMETVEVPWDTVAVRLAGAMPEAVAVFDALGVEIPSQVIYMGGDKPLSVIFQATVGAGQDAEYTIRKEAPASVYATQAYGRYVPERKDDYAWENNVVAFRLYGPALETETVTPGIDFWCRKGDTLVVNTWYAKADYHHDHGQGLDCYKVGPTLGAGASCVLSGGKLWLGRNWITQQTLDNGPLRTTVRLTYAPFDADGVQITREKYISLDANTHFFKATDLYSGADQITVAAGMPMHEGAIVWEEEGMSVALTEPASDWKDPLPKGYISLAVVMPGATQIADVDGHIVIARTVSQGEPLTYWAGGGWNGGDVENVSAWTAIIAKHSAAVSSPLAVGYK